MRKLHIAIWAAALVAAGSLQAQQRGTLAFGGAVLNQDGVLAGEMAQMSQPQALGTARSMALGGAFTSLGADLASMSINPAGLGMYRRNEIALTPMMTFQSSETPGTMSYAKNGKNRFSMANFGAALNAYEGTGTLTSFTVGIGLNRIADFNSRYSYKTDTPYAGGSVWAPTIADIFGQQLGQAGIFPNGNDELGYNVNPYYWPAVLGYNGFMISRHFYTDPETQEEKPTYVPDCIGSNASILHYMDVVNSGSINEFTISAGANLNNIVYIGATIGIQSVHKATGVYYGEDYRYDHGQAINSAGEELETQLDYADLYQKSVLDGSGVNFKLGVTVRPIESLRIGVAFHTPTYYSLERSYYGDITTQMYNNATEKTEINQDGTPYQDDMGSNSWCFTSPARLLFGISYTFGNFGLITVDYERDWYNGIRIKDNPNGLYSNDAYNDTFRHTMKGSNTVRIGAEFKPLPFMAIRAGFGYTGSMLRSNGYTFNEYDRHLVTEPLTGEKVYEYNPVPASSPMTREVIYYTAGLGFSITPNVVLDVAYQYQTTKHTDYNLFYFADGSGVNASGVYNTSFDRHAAALTLGFRF